jgi:hypothetical protein
MARRQRRCRPGAPDSLHLCLESFSLTLSVSIPYLQLRRSVRRMEISTGTAGNRCKPACTHVLCRTCRIIPLASGLWLETETVEVKYPKSGGAVSPFGSDALKEPKSSPRSPRVFRIGICWTLRRRDSRAFRLSLPSSARGADFVSQNKIFRYGSPRTDNRSPHTCPSILPPLSLW